MAVKFGNWQKFLDKTLSQISDDDGKRFAHFDTFDQRILFVKSQQLLDRPWITHYFAECAKSISTKSDTEANKWRKEGNEFFRRKSYEQAVKAYSKCIRHAVTPEGLHDTSSDCQVVQHADTESEFSLGVANRSAALYHLGHIQSSLVDIDLALMSGYPAHLRYKLYQRRAACYTRLSDKKQAQTAIALAESAINDLCVEFNKKEKLLEDLEKVTRADSQTTCTGMSKKFVIPSLHHGNSLVITQASQDVLLKYTEAKGRHLVADASVPAGSVIIVERPFAAVLLPSHYDLHCHHCFGRLIAQVPCRQCTIVSYCSTRCQSESWERYHKLECPYMELFHCIGIAHLSLRIVLTAGRQFLLNFRDVHRDASRLPGITPSGVYDRNYLSVYDLMPHDENMDWTDMLQYTLTAALLLRVLQEGGYFADDGPDSAQSELYIGSLLLRHICQLVCNAHAITELQVSSPCDGANIHLTDQVRVATAIYPTASLMNHSCDPTIISSFDKDVLVVRTMKDVKPGEEIFNCYGPHYCRMSRGERQRHLAEQYFFRCECEPCSNEQITQLQQQAFCCSACSGPMLPMNSDPVTFDPNSSSYSCSSCEVQRDLCSVIAQEVQAREDFVCGLRELQENNVPGAVKVLSKCLVRRKKILYRYHRALGESYDVLARCYAILGDFDKAAHYLAPSVTITEKNYGDRSIELANELQKYIEILARAGKYSDTLKLADRARQIFSLHYGVEHESVREVDELIRGVQSVCVT